MGRKRTPISMILNIILSVRNKSSVRPIDNTNWTYRKCRICKDRNVRVKCPFWGPHAATMHSRIVGRLQARAAADASLLHGRGEHGALLPIVGFRADYLPVPVGEVCEVGIVHDQGLADAREATAAVVGYEDHDSFSLSDETIQS